MRIVDSINVGIVPPSGMMANKIIKNPRSLDAQADRLKRLRLAHKLNQSKWCKLVEIGVTAWNNYERALRQIPPLQAARICDVTGATTDYIYRGSVTGLTARLLLQLQEAETPAGQSRPGTPSQTR